MIFEYPEKGNNGYVQEHTDLIQSIRDGKPINEAEQIANSTMTAIMGREACYSGKEITWEEMMQSTQNLVPDNLAFSTLPVSPVPVPGVTQVERGSDMAVR